MIIANLFPAGKQARQWLQAYFREGKIYEVSYEIMDMELAYSAQSDLGSELERKNKIAMNLLDSI
jgi:hypothetical protein